MFLSRYLVFFFLGILFPALSFSNPVNLTAIEARQVLDGPEEYFASLCTQARYESILSNSLSGRDDKWPPSAPAGYGPAVEMNKFQGSGTTGLWTFGLATCMGVGITGSPRNPEDNDNARFLMHTPASTFILNELWPEFEEAVKGAFLNNIKGYISTPSLDSDLPLSWTDEDKQYGIKTYNDVLTRLKGLVGDNYVVKNHPIKRALDHELPYGTMFIDTQNTVLIDGQPA